MVLCQQAESQTHRFLAKSGSREQGAASAADSSIPLCLSHKQNSRAAWLVPHDESPVLSTPFLQPHCSSFISSSRTDEIWQCLLLERRFSDLKKDLEQTIRSLLCVSIVSQSTRHDDGCLCNVLGDPVYCSLTTVFSLHNFSFSLNRDGIKSNRATF